MMIGYTEPLSSGCCWGLNAWLQPGHTTVLLELGSPKPV